MESSITGLILLAEAVVNDWYCGDRGNSGNNEDSIAGICVRGQVDMMDNGRVRG